MGHVPALVRCVGDPDRFVEEIWSRCVHLHPGADGASLLDLDDVDELLAGAALRAPAVRLVEGGDPVAPERYLRSARVGSRTINDLIDVGRVHALFDDGATIVLQGLHRFWPPLASFCRELEQALTHPVQANAYLTPPVASGLRVHADTHDVFALQTHGTKHWVTYPKDADLEALPPPRLDTHLQPGDCLYVPRGAPHAARTIDSASLHITLGVRALTWRDALRRATEQVLAQDDYDGSLPPGYAHQPGDLAARLVPYLKELASELAELDASGVATATADAFVEGRQPALTGQLRELSSLDDLDDGSELVRRTGTMATLVDHGARVELRLGDRRLDMPGEVRPALEWLLARDSCAPADLSPFLDEGGRVVLAKRLVREGLLHRRG